MYILYIPKHVSTDSTGYECLSALYYEALNQEDKEIKYNFDKCKIFDANLSAVLGALFDALTSAGKKVYLTTPKNETVKHTLARNNFFRSFQPEQPIDETDDYVNYMKFSASDSELFKEYIEKELFKKTKFPKHTEKAGKQIKTSIYEIFVNATTHGKCDFVYGCGEYKPDKRPPVLDMTIVDCGQTIYKEVNNFFGKEEHSPCSAIKWAMQEGNTTKKDTGGLGLSELHTFISLNKGALQIVSDCGMVEFRNGVWSEKPLSVPFPGTIVNMKFNFNDNKIYYIATENIDINNLL